MRQQEEAHYHHILMDISDVIENLGVDQVLYDIERHFPNTFTEIENFINSAKPDQKICALLKEPVNHDGAG